MASVASETAPMIVGYREVIGTGREIASVDPSTGERLLPIFRMADAAQVADAAALAERAFEEYRHEPVARRADFLDEIAERLEADRAALVEVARAETGLGEPWLHAELTRTTGQLQLFARVLREGEESDVRIDRARPERTPLPRPDLRLRWVPVGPVVVFGSSNFPFAFSNAGGDVASALAAGCTVIVKAHGAHLGTAAATARAVQAAAQALGLADGVYSSVVGAGSEAGAALAADPHIAAVAFTGSRAAGTSLVRVAASRPEPIPVFAEMSSVNPVVVLPSAAGAALAEGFVGSLTMRAGQLCTNPGLVFVPEGADGDAFVGRAAELIAESSGETMLTAGIRESFESEAQRTERAEGVRVEARGTAGNGENAPGSVLFSVSAEGFLREPELQDEMFGAAALVVRYAGVDELLRLLGALRGQLTASVQGDVAAEPQAGRILGVLERKAGRLIVNGWPTGVEVAHAMVHGGPHPATSAPQTTSVGTLALRRFLRPVSYQGVPDALLPDELRESNPLGLVRLVEGRMER